MATRDAVRELLDLGLRGSLFRLSWEARVRSGWIAATARRDIVVPPIEARTIRTPFAAPSEVVSALLPRLSPQPLQRLARLADNASVGRLECFSHWNADFGNPINWFQSPGEVHVWPRDAHWSKSLTAGGSDVKLVWEVGRFPHAFHMARAAALFPARAAEWAVALQRQIDSFAESNPWGRGVHWASGLEIAFRVWSLLFALHVFRALGQWKDDFVERLAAMFYRSAVHVHEYLEFSRHSAYNDHLIGEALAIYAVGAVLPEISEAARWRSEGVRILTEEAGRQFFKDGGYFAHSHNYHRAVLQMYMLATALRRMEQQPVPAEWLSVLDRSTTFLSAQMNPHDGWLPNFGSNDGGMPLLLSTCDYNDFRPVLQASAVLSRKLKLFAAGPWDEEQMWLSGTGAVALETSRAEAVSFEASGYHVLRASDSTFAVFRCGSLTERFSQIDMLSIDFWLDGQNVLTDPGTYRYNGAPEWHRHFTRTASHNTVTIDGQDQMLQYRQFKMLYLTRARLLAFDSRNGVTVAEGEHYGYQRRPGQCVHRRAVLLARNGICVIVDRIHGEGLRVARLHWLCGKYPYSFDEPNGSLALVTPSGEVSVTLRDGTGLPLKADVVAGQDNPPRGWLSRYYGTKVAVPSLAAVVEGRCPMTLVTVVAKGSPRIAVHDSNWRIEAGNDLLTFVVQGDGRIGEVQG